MANIIPVQKIVPGIENRPFGDSPFLGDGPPDQAWRSLQGNRPKGDCPQMGGLLSVFHLRFQEVCENLRIIKYHWESDGSLLTVFAL